MTSINSADVAVDHAIASIKSMVLDGDIGPGERLTNERELARQLGVSRGSLREAIRTLAAQGVLEARVGSGTFVTSLDPEVLLDSSRFGIALLREHRVKELLEVRRALDGVAARAAASRMTSGDHAQLRALIEVMCSDSPITERIAADVAFHRLIAARGDNAVVAAMLDAFAVDTEAARVSRAAIDTRATDAMRDEHTAIAQALRQRDPDAAARAAESHVTGLIRWVDSH